MLTHQQREVMLFVEAHHARTGGVSPTLAEIADHLKQRSRSNVERLLVGLERRGFIRRLPRAARAIEVLRPVSRFAFHRFDAETKQLRPFASPKTKEASES